ncbi:MAG: saccharopine dehydrogenase NADP-binding domain-containing protein [Acidobacteriaceae bacterium]
MSRRVEFGIVGGYGATGKAVVSELLKSGDGEILLGGRDGIRLEAAAAEFGRRVSTACVNILDTESLDQFCSRCSLIINCGGPVKLLQDRVAHGALRARCHYVDPAGLSFVKERMLAHAQQIADLGLSFVVSSGWMPGISELLPVHAYLQAKAQMDSIESVNVYFTDSGEWSDNALRDAAFYVRKIGFPKPGYFRKGVRVPCKLSEATRKIDLGSSIGLRQFSLVSMAELDDVGRRLTDCNFATYSYLSGVRTTATALMIALLPLSEKFGARLMRGIFRRNQLPVAGFVVAHVAGRAKGRSAVLKSRIVFEPGRDYWINSIALATVARMVSAAKSVTFGVHFLTEAVEPAALMIELRKAGVGQWQIFELCD